MGNRVRVAAAALLLGCSVPAAAQQAGPGGRTLYEAAYFERYSPSSALEIVRRVPGFVLELGAEDVRGFGQAAGNVVINGNRPSSKSDTLEAILARIPANRVARVEVGTGDLFGSEFSGRAQVLNLVLTSGGGLAGTVTATARRDYTGQITPEGSVSALYRRGASSFNLSAGYNNSHTPEEGIDDVTALPSGALLEHRRKINDISEREAFLSGSWEHQGGANRGAHLNFRVERERFELDQTNDVFPVRGPIRDDRLGQDYRTREFELGGDVTRPLWGGAIKLIGLATRRHRKEAEFSFNRIQGDVIGGYEQNVESQRDETLGRLVWSTPNAGGWSVEAGVEAVLNSLDSDVNLFELDEQGDRVRVDLPIDQAVVKEWRGEAFYNVGRSLSPTVRIDLGFTFEASRLTVRGDTEAERTLRFLKPKAVLDWRPKGPWHAQVSLIRTVAQLDFEDFISSAELTNDRVNAGNADLVPQRAWEGLLTVERTVLGDGLAKVELGYNLIEKVQDRVPTPEGFDAPGNLGTGRQAFVKTTVDLPLGSVGIKGGRFTWNTMFQDTSVEDPYTHRNRRFSGLTSWSYELGLRQDLGKFAWSVNYTASPREPYYWRDEIDAPNGREPFINAFVEYRPDRATTITLGADNILDVPGTRTRIFFAPDRSNPDPYQREFRERNGHVTAYLRFKRSFG
ncbi:hypothetical protein [Sphingosinicella sp. BN140058]|uniref:hypothetical protein n=1 Tax=Sphingosinicella sp. BN140058 TaxID=1892855 RepID=UPI001013AD49|nr:hypothetical protein [Sphingosinicella sp. BN140058]QAY76589.1 hypothetical protein ETR14_08840 [Sphingosinicella sp. BN140058]